MELNKFIEKVTQSKASPIMTGFFNVKVITDNSRTLQKLFSLKECKHCGHISDTDNVVVSFHESVHLTIFQAELLYAVFVLEKKPCDYAHYHNCIAGKEFIENIKKIEVS